MTHVGPEGCVEIAMPVSLSELTILFKRPCGLMDKALVCGANDCRFESCQGQVMTRRPVNPGGRQVASREKTPLRWMGAPVMAVDLAPAMGDTELGSMHGMGDAEIECMHPMHAAWLSFAGCCCSRFPAPMYRGRLEAAAGCGSGGA